MLSCRGLLALLVWTWASVASAQWYQSDSIRQANYLSVLDEIEERMPVQHQYRSSDKIGHVHETTHGLNSRLRNKHGTTGSINCAYIVNTNGVFLMLLEPKHVKLSTIADKIPQWLRDSTYKSYLINQQRYWNNEPLYVVDEWSAYYNGSVYGLETGWGKGARLNGSIARCFKFLYYSLVLVELHPDIKGEIDTLGQHTYENIVKPACEQESFTDHHNQLWEACRTKAQNLPCAMPLK